MENAITIILAIVLVAREYQNWRDRRDLLDRIMCVDYREFKKFEKPARPSAGNVVMSDEQLAEAEKQIGK